jgi:hypothetical protein
MIHLRDLGGLWRRALIAWPDGHSDRHTEVFWLQGPSLYADLRVPAGRPASNVACLRDLDRTMLQLMARQEGFFGRFSVADEVGQWQRTFDYQPDTGVADRGTLVFEDGILVERGIDLSYVEHWSRIDSGEGMTLALATEQGTPGCLVGTRDSFIYARGRVAAPPLGGTLAQLVDGAASLQAAQDLFDCEISFGRRRGSDWHIERSSHCFREGASLAPVFDERAGTLTVAGLTPEGARVRHTWRVVAQEGVPLRWFADARAASRTHDGTLEMAGAMR